MDILIPDSWLRKFLKTKATPLEIEKYLSLSGPSVEKVTKTKDGDYIYAIEVTTNRTDSASVMGIAREAAAILPRFGIKAEFKGDSPQKSDLFKNLSFSKKVNYLDVSVDNNLCPRFSALLIKNVQIKDSPDEIKLLLEKVGVRPINNIVDVSNFIMHEVGQPIHTFDYDKIAGHKMILRESKKGESVTTLDGKTFKLPGSDIVISDASKKLIDLCGIMGGQNSAIDENTKNVLLFVQNYNRHKIRKTSMTLAQRTEAAALFEKGIDPELVKPSILAAAKLIEKISGGVSEKQILDIYPEPYKTKIVKTTLPRLEKIIGIQLAKKDVDQYLTSLGFNTTWNGDNLSVKIPSFRADDMDIPEDIAEEVARIYGYHNLPSVIMDGEIPKPVTNQDFNFENKIKEILNAVGAVEVYTLTLTEQGEIKLKNPLGTDSTYLRRDMLPSLLSALKSNSFTNEALHIYELSNIYLKEVDNLPKEWLILAGITKNQSYRKNKGTIQTLLQNLSIDYSEKTEDDSKFALGQSVKIISGGIEIGEYGNLNSKYINPIDNTFYYEFPINKLLNAKTLAQKFKEPPKFPPQIEDITFTLPERTYIGEVIKSIKSVSNLINNIELKDVYNNSYTFRIWYQDPLKTLENKEVEEIRSKIIKITEKDFKGTVKG